MGFDGKEYLQLARITGGYECNSAAIETHGVNVPKILTLWIYIETSKVPKIDDGLVEARASQSTRNGAQYLVNTHEMSEVRVLGMSG